MSAQESLRQHMAQYDPTPTDADIEAEGYDGGERVGGWAVTDADSADWALRRIAEAEAAIQEMDDLYERQLRQLDAWREGEQSKTQRTIDFFRERLAEYHRGILAANPRAKTIRLPHGTMIARKAPDRVEVECDPESLPEWARVVTVFADRRAILKHLKETGEILPGVTVVPGDVKYYVKVADAMDGEDDD